MTRDLYSPVQKTHSFTTRALTVIDRELVLPLTRQEKALLSDMVSRPGFKKISFDIDAGGYISIEFDFHYFNGVCLGRRIGFFWTNTHGITVYWLNANGDLVDGDDRVISIGPVC